MVRKKTTSKVDVDRLSASLKETMTRVFKSSCSFFDLLLGFTEFFFFYRVSLWCLGYGRRSGAIVPSFTGFLPSFWPVWLSLDLFKLFHLQQVLFALTGFPIFFRFTGFQWIFIWFPLLAFTFLLVPF